MPNTINELLREIVTKCSTAERSMSIVDKQVALVDIRRAVTDYADNFYLDLDEKSLDSEN